MTPDEILAKRRGDFRAGALGLVVGLALLGYYAWTSRAVSAGDFVRVEVVPDDVSVVSEGRRGELHGLRIVAGGQRYQAENIYVENSGYTAERLAAALRPGEPVSLWVQNPDAETPRIRGIESATVSAPPATGVAAENEDRRFLFILGAGFAALGALSVALGLRRRLPNPVAIDVEG